VLKVRGWCIEIADLLAKAFPTSRNLFAYRDLRPWLVSGARAFLPLLPPAGSAEWLAVATDVAEFVPLLRSHMAGQQEPVTPIEVLVFMWLSAMRRYAELVCGGLALHAIRYEDLIREPAAIMGVAFANLGLPEGAVDAATRAFVTDSQEGTDLSRAAVGQRDWAGIQEDEWAHVRALRDRYLTADPVSADLSHLASSAAV
jgi:hypothetical protein